MCCSHLRNVLVHRVRCIEQARNQLTATATACQQCIRPQTNQGKAHMIAWQFGSIGTTSDLLDTPTDETVQHRRDNRPDRHICGCNICGRTKTVHLRSQTDDDDDDARDMPSQGAQWRVPMLPTYWHGRLTTRGNAVATRPDCRA